MEFKKEKAEIPNRYNSKEFDPVIMEALGLKKDECLTVTDLTSSTMASLRAKVNARAFGLGLKATTRGSLTATGTFTLRIWMTKEK